MVEKNLNLDTSNWKVYNYRHEQLDMFMKQDWGISHLHIFTNHLDINIPSDWGKIPILHTIGYQITITHLGASSKEEFHEQYEKICKLSLQEKEIYCFHYENI